MQSSEVLLFGKETAMPPQWLNKCRTQSFNNQGDALHLPKTEFSSMKIRNSQSCNPDKRPMWVNLAIFHVLGFAHLQSMPTVDDKKIILCIVIRLNVLLRELEQRVRTYEININLGKQYEPEQDNAQTLIKCRIRSKAWPVVIKFFVGFSCKFGFYVWKKFKIMKRFLFFGLWLKFLFLFHLALHIYIWITKLFFITNLIKNIICPANIYS